jgi:NADH-quinone oxidoreductase subunit H
MECWSARFLLKSLYNFIHNTNMLMEIFIYSVLTIIFILICVAYLTLAERKILGSIQLREGPSVVGLFGLLQPLADGLKLILKETIIPRNSNSIIFIMSPFLTFSLSLIPWSVIPFGTFSCISDVEFSVLFVLAVSSLNVYGIILAGWSSNSKYAFLGAIRSSAQIISYEVSMGLIVLSILVSAGSLNLTNVVLAQTKVFFIVPYFPLFVIFFISILAETNRTPFDLPEAEAELVAGYNVEYSSIVFSLFFLAEYSNMILMSSYLVVLFLGGWLPIFKFLWFIPQPIWFSFKVCVILFCFIWVRGTVSRYRYDQLMGLGWQLFLPLSLFYFIFIFFTFKVFV